MKYQKKPANKAVIIAGALLILLSAGLAVSHFKKPKDTDLKKFQATRFFMDTYIQLVIAAPGVREKDVNEAMNEAFGCFSRLEEEYNFFSSKGQLMKVNSLVDGTVQDLELLKILNMGLQFAESTDGVFDPTLGSLKLIYPIGEKNPVPPGEAEISRALALSGYKKVKISGNRVDKPKGLLFDLGGLLKGYAVDRAYETLDRRGFKNFMVNGGGNIRGRGVNEKGSPWRVGVENPRIKGSVVGVITLDDSAVATSGDYQRYFFYEGTRYHHILDPKTGRPAGKAIMATVICPDALTADVCSTTAFIMGREQGISFLEKRGLEGIILDDRGFEVTKGLKGRIQIDFGGEDKK